MNHRFFLRFFLFYLFSFTLTRILFHLYFLERFIDISFFLYVKSYLTGLRFDLSIIAGSLIPWYFLSNIRFLNQFQFYKYIWGLVPLIELILIFQLNFGDIIYYENANKHLGYEGFAFFGLDLLPLYISVIKDRTLLILSGFILLFSICFVFIRNFRKIKSEKINENWNFKKQFFFQIFILLLGIVFVRGGFQTSFLRPSHALLSNSEILNALSINPVFTTIYDLKKETIPKDKKMKLEEAVLNVQESIQKDKLGFENLAYPLLRKTNNKNTSNQKPNIVLILLESWSRKFIQNKIEEKIVTPRFNSLITESVYFPNFFATGGRTSNGLLATLTSLPDFPGQSALHSQEGNSKLSSLPKILIKENYQSIFMTGSDLGFENTRPHISRWGFQKVIDEKIIQENTNLKKGIWGYDDGDGLNQFITELKKLDPTKPFLGVYLTISTHHPYKVPNPKFEIFDSKVKDYEYLNTLHYSDFAIGEFMDQMKKEKFYENTIFVFVSDHTHHRYLNPIEDRNIPFLIHYPKKLKANLNEKIGNQLDIIPTLLGFVDSEIYFTSFGIDLFSENESFSYFCFGNMIGWVEKDFIYFINIYSEQNAVRVYRNNPEKIEDDFCKLNGNCLKKQRTALSYLNASIQLLQKNKIYPY
jgi:phosphoglycerol transferase MdoB-like AlkP superfamily enzyme